MQAMGGARPPGHSAAAAQPVEHVARPWGKHSSGHWVVDCFLPTSCSSRMPCRHICLNAHRKLLLAGQRRHQAQDDLHIHAGSCCCSTHSRHLPLQHLRSPMLSCEVLVWAWPPGEHNISDCASQILLNLPLNSSLLSLCANLHS